MGFSDHPKAPPWPKSIQHRSVITSLLVCLICWPEIWLQDLFVLGSVLVWLFVRSLVFTFSSPCSKKITHSQGLGWVYFRAQQAPWHQTYIPSRYVPLDQKSWGTGWCCSLKSFQLRLSLEWKCSWTNPLHHLGCIPVPNLLEPDSWRHPRIHSSLLPLQFNSKSPWKVTKKNEEEGLVFQPLLSFGGVKHWNFLILL